MEDILASIRRILSEEEGAAKAASVPAEPEAEEMLPAVIDESAPEDEPLELDMAMMVPDEPVIADPPDRPVLEVTEPTKPVLIAPAAAMEAPNDSLVAPEAARVASSSIASLMSTLANERTQPVYRGGPTIEDLVREEMRPMLKLWLDTYLPPMVERLVRAEIERVVNRATP
jgi:cell pole-organizing protein PopZ